MLCDLDDPGVAVGLIPRTALYLRHQNQHLNIMMDSRPESLNMLSCPRPILGEY